MGHGTEAASNGIYARMQKHLSDSGHDNFFVGTVEAEPTAEDLVKLVKAGGYEKVVLRPMMIVRGQQGRADFHGLKVPGAGLQLLDQIPRGPRQQRHGRR